MACESFQYNFPPIFYGDTWPGMTFDLSSTGTAFSGTLTSVTMGFLLGDASEALTLTQASGITIDVATSNAWRVTVDEILAFPLSVGVWRYYITLTDNSGVIQTRLSGTQPVKKK